MISGINKDLVAYLQKLLKALERNDVVLIPKGKYQGISEFRGKEVHPKIEVFPGSALIVNKCQYRFAGREQWEIVNRFLRSVKRGDNNYPGSFPVPFTTEDYNKCKNDCLALIRDFVERQKVSHPLKNKQFEDFARFKVEELN